MQAGYVQPGLMAAQPGYGQAGTQTHTIYVLGAQNFSIIKRHWFC